MTTLATRPFRLPGLRDCATAAAPIPSSARLKGRVDVSDSDTSPTTLERVAAGEPGAVAECIDRFGGLVWSLVRRLCRDQADAEDAVQDIFISVWKSAGRYDPGIGSEATFVATIARRRLIDRARRLNRELASVPLEESLVGNGSNRNPGNQEDAPSRNPLLHEESTLAEQAIRELSEDQQRVIRMAVLHGLSHERIATATGLPLGTVKTHIRRGLIKVRKILAEKAAERKAQVNGSQDGPAPEINRGKGVER